MRTLGKTFQNEDLVIKVLRCFNCGWQPKVYVICDSRDLSSMNLTTLFDKLQEYEMKLKRLNDEEEGDKKKKKNKNNNKKKSLALKSLKIKDMELEDEDSQNKSKEYTKDVA